jgi:CheY-like chemotaxis protein
MTLQESRCEILLAEDSPADVVLVREALKEHGVACTLHIVSDGEEAIAFIENLDSIPNDLRLDLLLLDMHLPKQDGDVILRRLRSTKSCSGTPVVVMTASDSPYDHETAAKHAVLHYFRKPSTLEQFLQLGGIVKGILSGKQPGSRALPGDGGSVGSAA